MNVTRHKTFHVSQNRLQPIITSESLADHQILLTKERFEFISLTLLVILYGLYTPYGMGHTCDSYDIFGCVRPSFDLID